MNDWNLKNGDEVTGHPGYCDLCRYKFGGSNTAMAARFLDGHFYHPQCFPKAVDLFLAVQKVKDIPVKILSPDTVPGVSGPSTEGGKPHE